MNEKELEERKARIKHNANVIRKLAEGCLKGGHHAFDAPTGDAFICMKCFETEAEVHSELDFDDPELQFWSDPDQEENEPPF
tara:strand:+ start:146 stop:391 length:246 start_codon:yes stop_codon:yes gene_type:complete